MTLESDSFRSRPRRWRRRRLLNVWVDDLTMSELLPNLQSGVLFTLNLDHLYVLQRNADFVAAYRDADFVTADSNYVFWSLAWIGRRIREKISGSDVVPAFCSHYREDTDVKIFLLGAGPGIAQRACERMNKRAGREIVVGAHGPSMNFVNDEREISDVLAMINASGATALIVGLGAPKQEIWIHRYRGALEGVKIFMGVGATIDYEANAVKRAPKWMRHGFEWLFRIATEPRRYSGRYVRDLEFFWLVFLDRFGLYRAPSFPEHRP